MPYQGANRNESSSWWFLRKRMDYILLDEPLNNLDLNHANQMMHLLKKLVEITW